eukprot:scaffold47917_cov32-Tisochrysis_lutea.AAC.1
MAHGSLCECDTAHAAVRRYAVVGAWQRVDVAGKLSAKLLEIAIKRLYSLYPLNAQLKKNS